MRSLNEILHAMQGLLNECATHEPSLVTAQDALPRFFNLLEALPETQVPNDQLKEDLRSLLWKTGVIGEISIDLASATVLAEKLTVGGIPANVLSFDWIEHRLGATSLQIAPKAKHSIGWLLTDVFGTMMRPGGSKLLPHVRQRRVENIQAGLKLLLTATIAGDVRSVFLADEWLRMTVRAVIYGRMTPDYGNAFRIYA